ncbi:MAG: hypothetical protein JXB29_00200 [Sedimentisphaerales bacterium]|nr:hypothetical protein [Sedimentisphaerales bacterium]
MKKFYMSEQASLKGDSEKNKQAVEDALSAYRRTLNKRPVVVKQNAWRIIMKSRITKLTVATVIIIAVLIGINQLGGSSVAWGNVINNVEQVQTFTCRLWTKMTSTIDKGTDQEAEIIVYDSSWYGSRIDTYVDGKVISSIYSQPRQNTCVMVIPEAKKYTRMSFTDEQYRQMQAKEKNPREFIKLFLAIGHTNLGRDTIDSVEVEGIEVNSPKVGGGMFESAIGRLWVDVETEFPVLMEIEGISVSGKTKIVMDEFQWDVKLEPSMFEPNIPTDYTLLAEVKMLSLDEGQMIKGLRLFAEISGGRYPSSLASMTVQEEFRNALEENYSGEPPREVIEKSMCINSISAFYTKLLEENKKVEYHGDKITTDDMDAELMRWEIAKGEFRVIYGDLRTENVVDKNMLLDMALKISGEKLPPHKRGKVLRMLSLNEKDLIRGLGVWLKLLDGKYPNSLEPKVAVKRSNSLLKAKYYDAKQVIKGKEKELEEKTYDLFFASAFYDKLVREKKDVAYYGDKITIEDSDKVLVRWKISDNQYRIVFGNLTRKTVTTKELVILEKFLE